VAGRWLGEKPAGQSIGGLGQQAAVVGQADLTEQLDRARGFEDRRERGLEPPPGGRDLLEGDDQPLEPDQCRMAGRGNAGTGDDEPAELLDRG
jgi:hypothetical protein